MKYEVWFKRSQECYAGIFNAKDRDDAIDQAVDKETKNTKKNLFSEAIHF